MPDRKTYRGFEDIPVKNFYKIAEDSDFKWFYKDYNGEDDFEVSGEDIAKMLLRYQKTYDDRVAYTNDIKSIEYYRKLDEISNLETKLYRLATTFDVLKDVPFDNIYFNEFVDLFGEDGYPYKDKVNTQEDKITYLEWLHTKIKGFKTKVKVKKALYKDILKPDEITEETAKFDIFKEKILLQETLLTQIDINTCPLIEWCAMVLRAEAKAKQAKKQVERIKNR